MVIDASAQYNKYSAAFPVDVRAYIIDSGSSVTTADLKWRSDRRRSVPLALGLSALVPGAGQAYNNQWVKAGALLATEVALVSGYVIWNRKGLDGEDAFRATAHADWDPAQYASWLNDYSDFLVQEHGVTVGASKVAIPEGIDFTMPDSWDVMTEVAVRNFFNQIRALEGDMIHPETGASFSHRLPYFGEQQYYELIGKYYQFAPGWGDYAAWLNSEGFTVAIDPETSGPNGEKVNVTDSFFDYAEDHAQSQTFLRRASRMTSIIFINHILAAADAAVFSKLHNDRISTNLSVGRSIGGELEARAHLKIRF